MTLKEFMNKIDFNDIRKTNQFYNNKPWFHLIENNLLRFLRTWYGRREILDTLETTDDVLETIDLTFMANTWKYDHLYSIYAAEYNPIWNYEGSETRETTRNLAEAHGGEDTTTSTEQSATEEGGTDRLTTTGGYKDQNSGTIQSNRTTFDSNTGLNTDGVTDGSATERTYNSLQEATSHGRTTEGSTSNESTTEYGSNRDVEEHVKETMTRGGNMGTTSTQSMMLQEMEVAGKLKLIEAIALDIVQAICYI